jgi:hypothetical protein
VIALFAGREGVTAVEDSLETTAENERRLAAVNRKTVEHAEHALHHHEY